ncbi:MAG: PadR family transcriptional regulator [Anaerosomatales bacterium]|nr:PadR family transcriptional regulator [Anaerosomatales bacterium]
MSGQHEERGPGRRRCCGSAAAGRGRGALLEPAVLAALARGESHGYDLVAAIEEITGGAVVADTGGLYRVLRRLEDEGSVISHWEEGEAGPARRSYRLTDEGRELLAHWLQHLRERKRALDALVDVVDAAAGDA